MTAVGLRRAARRISARVPVPDYALEAVRFGSVLGAFLPYVSPLYPTRDHIIPAQLFYLFYRRLDVALALWRLNVGRGTAIGAQLLHGQVSTADVQAAMPEEDSGGE